MLPLYTISTKPETIYEQCKLSEHFSFSPVYQARPGMQLPIIIQIGNKTTMVKARWGTKRPLISIERILTKPPFNILVRKQRCAVPANCFYSAKGGQPYLIRVLQHRMFLMGGLFHFVEGEFHFTLLQAHPADVLSGLEGQMPILMESEKLLSWLKGTEVGKVIHYADRAGSYWFDFYPVSKEILDGGVDRIELLNPEGISQQAMKDHEKKLAGITFEKERPNRSNLKH